MCFHASVAALLLCYASLIGNVYQPATSNYKSTLRNIPEALRLQGMMYVM